ncbi:MAG: glycosyltransferase [Clostridia bacterium]|nr:glycosyltransferase [Clostridia bacterium]
MNRPTPFFSVILPVYNGARTLSTAAVSILTQTFSDFELLIIENGSTDNSLGIALAFAKAFDKVRVIHLDGSGVSRARNCGLDNARGEYVVFLDADDLYTPDALEAMHSVLEKENTDLIIAGFTNYALIERDTLIHASGRELYLALLDPVKHYSSIVEDGVNNDFLLRHQCGKAYRRAFLEREHLRFCESSPIYVDLIFNSTVYPVCDGAVLMYKKLYRYNTVGGSLVNRVGSAYVSDSIAAFAAHTEGIDALDDESRGATLFSAFLMISRMVSAYSREQTPECRALLDRFLQSDGAQTVINGVRSENLHLIPEAEPLFRHLLACLRRGDLDAAVRTAMDTESAECAKKSPNEPIVSIVSPVYNSEKHLKRCVDSILAQTFVDFEALFIDDGSTDGSAALLERYAEIDPRIKPIRLGENGGQGAARNRGIDEARGKYLVFVDSDDMLAPDFIELLYNKAETSGAAVVKGSALWVTDEKDIGKTPPAYNELIRKGIANGVPLILLFRSEHWSAIYRRDFIIEHSIRYGDSRTGQDVTFLLKVCTRAGSIETEDAAFYYYFQNEGSMVHRFDARRFKAALDALEEQLEFIASSGLDKNAAVGYAVMNARFVLGMHAYMLSEELPGADEFAERLYGILTRFGHADEMKRADFGLREFLRSGGRANVDPTLTVIGLKDCTKVRRAALERLQAYSDELKKQ